MNKGGQAPKDVAIMCKRAKLHLTVFTTFSYCGCAVCEKHCQYVVSDSVPEDLVPQITSRLAYNAIAVYIVHNENQF